MSRTLAIVAGTGLTLCTVLLGGAWALGGDNVFHDPRSMEGLKPLIDLAAHKEWRWAGGDTLALDAPMTIRYQPQGKPNVTITGPAEAMDHVHVAAGRISSDAQPKPRDTARLQAVVSGVPIRKFVVNGGESLQLGHVDQDELAVHINGKGSVSGDGKVGHLTLALNGPGSAMLGALEVGDATVSVLGPGDVTLSPHGDVKLFVAGNARIRLLTRPASIQRRIIGPAVIETPDGTEEAPGPVSAREPRPATPATPPTPPTPAGAMPMPMPVPMPVPERAERVERAERPERPETPERPEKPEKAERSANRVQPGMPGVVFAPGGRVFVNGPNSANLGHIDQDRLVVMVGGSATVRAEGRVDTLELTIGGSGNVKFEGLAARRVIVSIAGHGNAIVAPSEELRATILGSGNVRLATRPQSIERKILGNGRVIELP